MYESETEIEYTLKQRRHYVNRVNIAIFLLILLPQLLSIVVHSLVYSIAPGFTKHGAYNYLLSAIMMYFFGGTIAVLALIGVPHIKHNSQHFDAKKIAILACICWALMMVGNLMGQCLNGLIQTASGVSSSNYVMDSIMTNGPVYMLIFGVILGPIMEELIFRKLLCDRLAILGSSGAVIVSGLAFGLFHGNLYQFFYAFMVGAVFAFVYVRTGKIRNSIILHMIMNFFGGFMPAFLLKYVDLDAITSGTIEWAIMSPTSSVLTVVYFIFAIAEYVFAVIGIVMLIKNYRSMINTLEWKIPKGERLKAVLLNPGAVLMLASAIAVMLYTYLIS